MGNDNRNSYHDGNHSHRLLDSGFRIIVGRKDAVMAHQKNIIVATFPEESKVYQAFSEVKQLGGKRAISIHGLAIVRRGADGRLELPDVASRGHGGSMTGGLIGSLVGILGGPIGILLGWGTGALLGSIRDAGEVRADLSLLETLSAEMRTGDMALMGEIEEEQTSRVDGIVRKLGGEILRRPADDIEREIATARKTHSQA
jgi:uncharacterized membrane protein